MTARRFAGEVRAAGATLALVTILFSFLVSVPPASAFNVTVTVLAPAGGEVWSGGSVHEIQYSISSDSGNPGVHAWILYDSDTDSGLIADPTQGMTGGVNSYNWTLPPADLTNVTIEVCAEDFGPPTCDTSPAFTVDGTRPSLTTRSPSGNNIALDAPIEFHLSEPVEWAKAQAAFSVSPDPGGISLVKTGGNGFRTDHWEFDPGQTYTVTISCVATDLSDPGNPLLGCPVSWTFTADTPPTIAITSPAGAVDWTGGSSHTVRWTAADQEDPLSSLQVYLQSSLDGVSWSSLAGPLAGDASYAWTLPTADTTAARVRATVFDTRGLNETVTTPAFRIDSTPPSVSSVSPVDGATGIGWSDPVLVAFSEPVMGPATPATLSVQTPGGAYARGLVAWASPTQLRFTPSVPYVAGMTYTARVNATLRDASDPGNPFPGSSWSFTTKANRAPSISLSFTPASLLSGGSAWTASWTASDPDDVPSLLAVYVEFSDGGPFAPLAGPLPANASYLWTAPTRDLAAATLRVRVVDSQGGTAAATRTFAIDATSPTITAKAPAPGASDVLPNATIVIGFSEPVDPATATVGLRVAATGAWVTVTTAWDGPQTLRLTPVALLREGAAYEVVVNDTIRDLSIPGNHLAATSWTFRVIAFPPTVSILAPAPGIRWSAGVPQTVLVQAADVQDPAVMITADLSFDGLTFTPLLAATPMANGQGAFAVTPPSVDAAAVLRVCAADSAGATACATIGIALDATPPAVAQTVPDADARRVSPDAPIILRFSESVIPATVEATLAMQPSEPFTFRWARTIADNDTAFLEHPRLPESFTYTITLGCGVTDTSVPGLSMRGACPFSFAFTTAASPQVRMLFPVGGERLTGGAAQAIRWTAASEEPALRATVDLSYDGGVTFPVRLADALAMPVGEAALPDAIPPVDAGTAVVRVAVKDSLGLTATASSKPFAIDATPPRLLSSTPADNAANVSPLADIVLVFGESLDPATLNANSVAATPPIPDASVIASSTNVPFDTLRIRHAAFYEDSLDLRVTVRDASTPGNSATVRVAFSVFLDREVPRITMRFDPDAVEGQTVHLDASGSADNVAIGGYAWTIRDEGGFPLAELTGPTAEWRAPRAGTFNVTLDVADTSGNVARASAPLRVHALPVGGELPPSPSVTFLGWLALAGAGGSSAYGLTDRGRSFLSRTFLLPLYVRLKPEAIMNQETRGMIRGYIRVNPGDCYTDIKRNLGLANGELAYHLSVLEREGIVRSTTRGAKRVYYPAEVPMPEDGGGLHEIQRRLLKNIEEVPGMTVRDLAGILGVTSQLALYHVRKLGEDGLVRLERRGMKLLVHPTTAEERLEALRREET